MFGTLDELLRDAARTSRSSRCRPRSTSPRRAARGGGRAHAGREAARRHAPRRRGDHRRVRGRRRARARSGTSSASTRRCWSCAAACRTARSARCSSSPTERIGPFPDRIRDVGVVKDLATHDLDLVRWLGGAPVERVAAETQHRMGRSHEDMVLATGRLSSGVTFNCTVDWLSPAKVRRTEVLGERGMLVADTLTADLAFYANGQITSVVVRLPGAARRLGGRHDPLRAVARASRCSRSSRRSATCSAARRRDPVVTLAEGLATRGAGRGRPRPARPRGETIARRGRRREGRRRRAGEGRAAAGRAPDHGRPRRSTGADIDPRVVERVNAGTPQFPGEAGLAEALAEAVAAGRLRATTDTTAAVAEGPDLVVAVPPLMVDAAAEPDWAHPRRGRGRHRRRAEAGHAPSRSRRRCRSARHARASPPRSRPPAASPPSRTSTSSSAPSASTAAGSCATSTPTPSSSAASARRARRAASSSTARSSTPRSGAWARPRPPSWPSSPRRPTAT